MKEIKKYYKNGQIREHYLINENNKIDGEYKEWYDTGHLLEHCFYKNGVLDGEYKRWYENGIIYDHFFIRTKCVKANTRVGTMMESYINTVSLKMDLNVVNPNTGIVMDI